jgi:signal transduction histidine kinase
MPGSEHPVFTDGLHLPEPELEARMIRELDAFLGHPPRRRLEAGALLFGEDVELDSLWILLDGQVRLFRTIQGQEVVFHSQTVGRIVGLLAFASRNRSFFACRAVTPVTLLEIRFEDLSRALESNPALLGLFSAVLLRSMARRNRRLVELQTEVLSLNQTLAAERDQLARTLRELQQAQALLVESEKMATLGQIAAGVAHELNNPIAAIARASDFLGQDLQRLAGSMPGGDVFREHLARTLAQNPPPPRALGEARPQGAPETGDETLASRMVEIGLAHKAELEEVARQLAQRPEQALETLAGFHQVGAALRNIERCARRITDLVQSLRSYARADEPDPRETDLREGLDDTLNLLAHRLREVEVDRQYGDLPPVSIRGGELNQVWTNLIVNALDAMKNRGRLVVRTEALPSGHVAVHIIDSGPGIPPEHKARIFDLQFTTRQGRVEFGLGLGLAISRNIVTRLGGTLTVESSPGCTDFCVTLPRTPPVRPVPQETTP